MDNLESLQPPIPEEEIAAADDQPAEVKTPVEGEKKEPREDEKKQTLVPHAALHEERKKRQELEARFRQETTERQRREAVLADRVQQLYAAAQQNNQPQIDANDPIAVHEHKLAQLERANAEQAQRQQWEDQQRQQASQTQALIGWAQGQAQEFKAEAPDFDAAYKHVADNRVNQLRAMGLSPQEINAAMVRDELWVYDQAYRTGKNPAQVIYEMAKNTGYAGRKDNPEQKMQTLQKGLEASKNLGNGGGQAGWPTAEQIADMPEADFAALKAKLRKSGKVLSDLM
jgi:hypothetical protein